MFNILRYVVAGCAFGLAVLEWLGLNQTHFAVVGLLWVVLGLNVVSHAIQSREVGKQ